MPKIGNNNLSDLLAFCGLFVWKYFLIISLKAPGNYLDQFGSNKMSVSLWEGPKPDTSMISGFLTPESP